MIGKSLIDTEYHGEIEAKPAFYTKFVNYGTESSPKNYAEIPSRVGRFDKKYGIYNWPVSIDGNSQYVFSPVYLNTGGATFYFANIGPIQNGEVTKFTSDDANTLKFVITFTNTKTSAWFPLDAFPGADSTQLTYISEDPTSELSLRAVLKEWHDEDATISMDIYSTYKDL